MMVGMNHLYTFEPVRNGRVDSTGVVPIVAENDDVALERFAALWRTLNSGYQLASLKNADGALVATSAEIPRA